MSNFLNDSIFWLEVDKIRPNPYQPRREFDEAALQSLSDSIRQYGVLQALVVTRKEEEKPEGGLAVYYELIAGERRLRASKLAGVREVPALIKTGDESDQLKLELAIIENIQREDLNPIDRAKAFQQLADKFGFTHGQIGKKVGKSRVYVSNTIRLLALPEDMQQALSEKKITEGHTRPLLMLIDRPDQQQVLFKEIMLKNLTVRDAESIARRIAYEKVRKGKLITDPETIELEEQLQESLGTRVRIERKENGGRVQIDFFSNDDLQSIITLLKANQNHANNPQAMMEQFEKELQNRTDTPTPSAEIPDSQPEDEVESSDSEKTSAEPSAPTSPIDASTESVQEDDGDLYSVSNFTV